MVGRNTESTVPNNGEVMHMRSWQLPGRKGRAVAAAAGWLPFLFVFAILPTSLYLANPLEFQFQRSLLYPYWGAALLAAVALIAFSQLRLWAAVRGMDLLFFAGIFAVVSDGLIPLDWGLMDGESELNESVLWSFVQGAIATLLLVLWWLVPPLTYRAGGAVFVALLCIWQIVLATSALAPPPASLDRSLQANAKIEQSQALPNIYQIVFDAYSGPVFPHLTEKIGLTPELDGFTYFANAMANYQVTAASGPSYLTGKLFKGGSFKEFQVESQTDGLTNILQQAGYRATSYTPDRSKFWSHRKADTSVTTTDMVRADIKSLFALLVAVRATPEPLREETSEFMIDELYEGKASYSYYKRLSVPLMEQFMEDEGERPGNGYYHYIHLVLPHAPYVWGGDCAMREASDYWNQAECATLLMKRFVARLKELKRYDNSLIVIHSDHGIHFDLGLRSKIAPMPKEALDKLEETGGYFSARGMELRLQSLLLIKPPKTADEPLNTSETMTQLVDIPATIFDLVSLPTVPGDGRSVFSNYRERDLNVFTGYYRRARNGGFKILGQNAKSAELGHLVYKPEGVWEVRENIDAVHEGW